jgi:hypothetical protein
VKKESSQGGYRKAKTDECDIETEVGFEFALLGAFFVPRKNIKMDFTRNS